MADQLASARESVRRASDRVDDATVRERLRSIDEGLQELTERASTAGDRPHGDDLEVVERTLVGLADDVEGPAREDVRDARDAIDDYRRASTRDW